MQNIHNLSDYIEQLAQASIFDLNNANKALAEQEFTSFVFQLPLDQYEDLLEGSSEHVVLAFGAVLLKNIASISPRILEVVGCVNTILMRWYQPNGSLRRQCGDELKLYVENTFGQFMGNCLRQLFQRPGKQWKGMIGNFLENLGGKPHYRLFLYYRFIESFSNTVESIPYVEFRTHLSNFQDVYIPRIFEALFPYFINISDAMDFNELSSLQNALTLGNTVIPTNNPNCALEFNVKNRFTEVVFQLLNQVTAFRFNVNQREYDEMQEFQNIQISFPQELLVKVMKQSFLQALYSILMQLMRTSEFRYQETCFNCLKKILLAKVTYISRDMQTLFIFNNMEGVLRLLRLIIDSKVAHRLNALHIIQCALNFVRTFGFADVYANSLKDPRCQAIFHDWLEVARAVPLYFLQFDTHPLDVENELFLVTAELSAEISNELQINNIKYDKNVYAEYYRAFTNAFLTSFLANPKNILGSQQFTFSQLKRASKDLLGNFKLIATYNYAETFAILNNACDHLFNLFNEMPNELGVGNLILLIEEMIREENFLAQSVFGPGLTWRRQGEMEETSSELCTFGHILAKTVDFIFCYQKLPPQSSLTYLNNAIVVFITTLLVRSSRKLTMGDSQDHQVPPFINDEVHRQMNSWLRMIDEQFLTNCVLALAWFIRVPRMFNLDFVFEQLNMNIGCIKTGMGREYFLTTKICFQMVNLFREMSLQPMPIQYMKWRVLLFRIITTLSFSNCLDNYRANVRATVDLLKVSVANKDWAKILYDLTGIFETMDNKVIFRFFLRTLFKQLRMQALLRELFLSLGFANPKAYLSDVLHLSWSIIKNYSSRIQYCYQINNVYTIIKVVLPFWIQYLQNEAALDVELSQVQMYNAFYSMIEGRHINLSFLDNSNPGEFRLFFKLILHSMARTLQSIESSTELAQVVFTLGMSLVSSAIKGIFNVNDLHMGGSIHYFVCALMRKLMSFFESLATGMLEENLLEPMIKIIDKYYEFVRTHQEYYHLPVMMANIQAIMNDVEGKAEFMEVAIKIAMEFRNHYTTPTQLIANICITFIQIYNIDANWISSRLGLNDPKDSSQLARICLHVREEREDFEWLTSQMKGWLKMDLRFVTHEITQY